MYCETDGTGYVEDGREIFDDDDEYDEIDDKKQAKSKQKAEKVAYKKRLRDVNKPVQGNASIRSMFGNVAPAKKKEVKLDDDDILAGILGEIEQPGSSNTSESNKTNASDAKTGVEQSNKKLTEKTEMALVKEYMANFTKNVQRKSESKTESTSDDVRNLFLFYQKTHFSK